MPKLTALQACQQTHDLWTQIAQEAEKGHHKEKEEIPGPWQNYLYNCPCCEKVKSLKSELRDCGKCPMKTEWIHFLSWPEHRYFCCKAGPYSEWSSGKPSQNHSLSCYDLAFFAYLIADMALEAMERIKRETEATP